MKRVFSRFLRLLTACLLAGFFCCVQAMADGLTVHFMDIDRNDGILIECDGEAVFIDSGTIDFGQRAVDYMHAAGVTQLKYYIGTHAHKDHVGGSLVILPAMQPSAFIQPHDGVRRLLLSCCKTDAQRQIIENAHFITAAVGETYSIGSAKLLVLGPLVINPGDNRMDHENDNSLVCRLTYGTHSFLLTGDCPTSVMATLEAAHPGCLACTVLKNPHHNSPLDVAVLAACHPDYVVYSTSDAAQPTRSALHAVSEIGALALITSPKQNGTVVFHTDGETLTYTVQSGPTSLSFAQEELSLYVGRQKSGAVRLEPSQYKAVTYRTADPTIARVDGEGKVTGVTPGETRLIAQTGSGLVAECPVRVLPVGISLSREALNLKVGGNDVLRASLSPKDATGYTLTFVSDDPAVATVDVKGRVTGISPGATVVRAMLSNGSQAACAVTVH